VEKEISNPEIQNKENLSIMKPLFMHYCALWLCVVSSRREKIFEKQKIKKRKPLHYETIIYALLCAVVVRRLFKAGKDI